MRSKPRVVVVGAGLGGLCAGIKLKQAGFDDFVILEKGDRVGGTWRDNTYPGCACDTPVSLYQFSFAPSLGWSHVFPRAAEIQAYAEQLADGFGLRPHLRFGEEPTTAAWNDARATWELTTRTGTTFAARALISALGQLNRPLSPEIEGRERFAGAAFHSARWDHSVDLTGKRVGVIGSAASAVQLIPEVAKTAGHLTVFQRSANWLLPRLDHEITEEDKALLMTAPHVAALGREQIYQSSEHLLWQAFSWTPEGRAAYTRQALMHLEAQVPDPALRARLTPDYPIGCKRILFADDYYPALLRSNVSLVTDPIVRMTSAGIETGGGVHHDLDVVVFATGFETTGWHWSLDVVGRSGRHLHELWARGPEAYLGITTAHCPNLFMLYGPNTNLGHNAITFMIERQVEYAVRALEMMHTHGFAALEVKQAAQERFNQELQAALAKTTWADPGCRSWYKTPDGRITQNWSSHTRDYALATSTLRLEDYDVRTV